MSPLLLLTDILIFESLHTFLYFEFRSGLRFKKKKKKNIKKKTHVPMDGSYKNITQISKTEEKWKLINQTIFHSTPDATQLINILYKKLMLK